MVYSNRRLELQSENLEEKRKWPRRRGFLFLGDSGRVDNGSVPSHFGKTDHSTSPRASSFSPPKHAFQDPNRQTPKSLEMPVTYTKQTPRLISNRKEYALFPNHLRPLPNNRPTHAQTRETQTFLQFARIKRCVQQAFRVRSLRPKFGEREHILFPERISNTRTHFQ